MDIPSARSRNNRNSLAPRLFLPVKQEAEDVENSEEDEGSLEEFFAALGCGVH